MPEVKLLKGEEGMEMLLEGLFDTCSSTLNMKLTQVTTMAAIKAGVAMDDYRDKTGLFTMHDGVTVGDGKMVFRRLMEDVLPEIVVKRVNFEAVYPFEAIKDFVQVVDKITFEFV